jgi:hypothetical protein
MSDTYSEDLLGIVCFHGHLCPGLVIGYRADMERRPAFLCAAFAHELGHCLLVRDENFDKRSLLYEREADVATVFLGFGLPLAENFPCGYLEGSVLAYALAIFTDLRGICPDFVERRLRKAKRGDLRKAYRFALIDVQKGASNEVFVRS